MFLIADSGSTKTDWALVGDNGQVAGRLSTQGINPIHQTDEEITQTLQAVNNSLIGPISPISHISPISPTGPTGPTPSISLFFYGSGCTPEQVQRMRNLLSRNLINISCCDVYSDMTGAARALFQDREGIACILGTGANSCLYNGRDIVQNTPALGYVLGDEGSGAVLGRKFLNALYKGRLPVELKETFEKDMQLTMSDVIRKVYREPLANRFLASLSLFIGQHLDVEPLRQLVVENFCEFFSHNIAPYNRPELPVSFVGSMAYHYENELREAAKKEHVIIGQIIKAPLDKLITYHAER